MYRNIRNKVNNAIQSAKRNNYKSNLVQNDRNPQKRWKVINEIISKNNGKNICNVPYLTTSDGKITDRLVITNELNNYFCNIGQL